MARKNPWLFNPRAKKLVKPHLRVTKKGVSWVEGFMHEYPSKLNELFSGRIRPKKKDEPSKIKVKKDSNAELVKKKARCLLGLAK